MAKLVLATLTDDNKLEKFEEIDMSWVTRFNEEFKENPQMFSEKIYNEELIDMTSHAVLNSFVETEDDSQFVVNREPLREILRKLFGMKENEQ